MKSLLLLASLLILPSLSVAANTVTVNGQKITVSGGQCYVEAQIPVSIKTVNSENARKLEGYLMIKEIPCPPSIKR